MNQEAQKCLARPDAELFVNGGCHVLAFYLAEFLQDTHLLTGVHVKFPGVHEPFSRVIHVVWRSETEVVHGAGREDWVTYTERTRNEAKESDSSIRGEIQFEQVSVLKEDLLKSATRSPVLGLLNHWGFMVDPDFVDHAGRRAVALIPRLLGHQEANQTPLQRLYEARFPIDVRCSSWLS